MAAITTADLKIGDPTIEELLDLHRATFGPARMEDSGSDSGSGSGTGSGSDSGSDSGSGSGSDDYAALKKSIAAERKLRDQAEKARRAAERKVKEYEDKNKTEAEKAAERAQEAENKAKAAGERLLRAEIRAAAVATFADPVDVYRFLDLEHLVDDDGNPDSDEIDKALEQLLKDKPYLAKDAGPGDADQGGRRGGPSDVESLTTDDFANRYSRHKK